MAAPVFAADDREEDVAFAAADTEATSADNVGSQSCIVQYVPSRNSSAGRSVACDFTGNTGDADIVDDAGAADESADALALTSLDFIAGIGGIDVIAAIRPHGMGNVRNVGCGNGESESVMAGAAGFHAKV